MGLQASYDGDVVAWANEQARLLRAGRFAELDIEHIADEVEDVGKSEQRELAHRMSQLLAHLLKWHFQPDRRGRSWNNSIRVQRREIRKVLTVMPSLKPMFNDCDWLELMWADAVVMAERETGIAEWPEACIWSIDQIMDDAFLPE